MDVHKLAYEGVIDLFDTLDQKGFADDENIIGVLTGALQAVVSATYGCAPNIEAAEMLMETDRYLVGTTQGITRTLDRTEVLKLADRLPEDTYENVFTWKPALDLANYRALKDMAPNLASMVDDAITSKPSKPAVKVEAKS